MAISRNTAILVLAAGASSRMGETKQLMPWEDTTLLGNAIQTAQASDADSVTVVLGANAAAIRKEIPQTSFRFVENAEWRTGLGSSIACGTKSLSKLLPKVESILVMLADQPLIDTVYLNAMLTAFRKTDRGVATAYNNWAGVPALFPESYFKRLATLRDDFGAKDIINNVEEVFLVLQPGPKTRDIDTKSDYKELINSI